MRVYRFLSDSGEIIEFSLEGNVMEILFADSGEPVKFRALSKTGIDDFRSWLSDCGYKIKEDEKD